MSERHDVIVQGVTAEARATANPGRTKIEFALLTSRLTLLGVLVTVGLGVAGIVVSAGNSLWLALLAGSGSFAATVVAIHCRPIRHRLARFAEWVLPDGDLG